MSVIIDPTGAAIALWQSKPPRKRRRSSRLTPPARIGSAPPRRDMSDMTSSCARASGQPIRAGGVRRLLLLRFLGRLRLQSAIAAPVDR